jgi:hypothetical protein
MPLPKAQKQTTPESIFRGSCTCNIPTQSAYKAAEAAFESIQAGDVSVADTMEGIRYPSAPGCSQLRAACCVLRAAFRRFGSGDSSRG